MTLLFVEGFDWTSDGNDLLRKGWSQFTTTFNPSTSYGRYGSKGILFDYNTWKIGRTLPPSYATVCVGFAYKGIQDPPTYQLDNPFLAFKGAYSVRHLGLYHNGSDIEVRDSAGTLLGEAVGVYSVNVWRYLEVKVTISDTVGVVEVRLNGTEIINETGLDTKNQGSYIEEITIQAIYNNMSVYIDDFYITDGDFLGDVRVKTYFPDSDGTYSMFSPSSGSDNYAMVDDTDPDDDSTYVESATLNAKDTYGITPSFSGLVKALQLCVLSRKTGTTKVKTKNLIRSGGSDYNSSAEKHLGFSYDCLYTLHETDPDDSNPWTQTKVENAEFGMEITAITSTTTSTTTTTA